MRHRDPCNWKCTSSMAHRSTSPEQAPSLSFFIFPLLLGVCVGNHGSWLSHAKAKLSEKPLALPHPQSDSPPYGDKRRKSLSIPQVGGKSILHRAFSQSLRDFLQLFTTKPAWAARPLDFCKPGKPLIFKPLHPVGNCSGSISKESGNLSAAQALSHKKNSVQPVIVARLIRSADFILESEHHFFGISDFGFSHSGMSVPL